MNNSRTTNSITNSIIAVITQIIIILISFIGRTFFIKILGAEYLGINGLFTNILSILAFAELGIGTAIIYSLYKPFAEKDEKKISAYANLYKKAYRAIGIIILTIGIIIIPLLPIVIKDFEQYSNVNINLIYVLFLLNSTMTYFYSYKRSLIVANQKKYIDSINRVICLILLNAIQIFVLYKTHNYILYLVFQILFSILENISITIIANKMYPYIKSFKKEKITEDEKKDIVRNVKALIMHKIGSTVVSNTDNLLMSAYIGLNTVGIYSNYNLIITAIKTIVNQMFASITASVGNLNAENDNQKSYLVFWKIEFANFWMITVISIILLTSLNDFIKLWIGEQYLLEFSTLLVIVLNFFLYEMRQTIFIYKNTYAIFRNDKYVPIIESIINLVASIILIKYFGIVGIFAGTIISTLCTCFWTEPYFLYKVKFKRNLRDYFKKYSLYVIIAVFIAIVTSYIANMFYVKNILFFIIKVIICFIISNILLIIFFHKTQEFKFYKEMAIGMARKLRKEKKEV